MDNSLVDLDVLLNRVRNPRSRNYLQDGIRAYRSGALRPALTAVWVAVAFDLVSKIRELADLGDGEAGRIFGLWDSARARNDIRQLMQLERDLIDQAATILQLLNPIETRQIKRLQEDRHLCAHPAFSSDAELFEPSSELVRLHIVTSVDLILSRRPVQGRTILEEFSVDLVSPGFPSAPDRVSDYFERQYIERTRPNSLSN